MQKSITQNSTHIHDKISSNLIWHLQEKKIRDNIIPNSETQCKIGSITRRSVLTISVQCCTCPGRWS